MTIIELNLNSLEKFILLDLNQKDLLFLGSKMRQSILRYNFVVYSKILIRTKLPVSKNYKIERFSQENILSFK